MADPVEAAESSRGHYGAVLQFPTPVRDTRRWRFDSAPPSLHGMRQELRRFLRGAALPETEIDDLVLAACEAAANGVEHARDPSEPFFDVLAEIDGRRVRIVVRDYGRWTTDRHEAEDRGRGLHMMTKLAAVSLTSGPSGTWVTLRSAVDGRADS